MKLTLPPVDAGFFESAPERLVGRFEIARPAAEVWAELTSDHPLEWCKAIDDITWTTPRPFGEGTTRTVKSLKGASVFEERFFRWEEGRRKSFYVERTSNPMVRRFAEDYLVEPTGESSCTFTWVVAFESRPWARPFGPVNRRILGSLFRDTREHFGA